MAYNYEYPYTDPNRFNVDWLLNEIKKLRVEMSEFVNLNTIRFHDPIQWDITTQYEKLEVVTNGGYAYLSKKPVPVGVAISNTDYWQNIGQFNIDGDTIRKAIAEANEEFNLVASKDYVKSELLWFKGDLYECVLPITIGSGLVVDTNIALVTIEELIKRVNERVDDIIDLFNTTLTLNDLVVNGDTTINGDTEVEKIKINDVMSYSETDSVSPYFDYVPMKDINGNDYNVLVQTVLTESLTTNVSDYITPEEFGAVGDGVTDDTVAIQNCFDSASTVNKIIKAINRYKITDTIYVPSNITIDGFNKGLFIDAKPNNGTDFETKSTFYCGNVSNIKVLNCNFEGPTHTTQYKGKYMWLGQNASKIYFTNCTFSEHDGVGFIYMRSCSHIWVTRCLCKDYSRACISFVEGTSDSGVLYSEIADGHETNTLNRYPLMLCGYDQDYTGSSAPQGSRLYAIGNYIHDTEQWWEGIDCHGGNYVYIAHNTIKNIACPISVFTNRDRGFRADYVYVHDNDCQTGTRVTTNPSTKYGCAFGGTNFFVHHNRFRNGGYAYPDSTGANIYFDAGSPLIFSDNVVENSMGSGLLFSGSYSNLIIRNNIIAGVQTGDRIGINFLGSTTIYKAFIEGNIFQSMGAEIKTFLGKSTTAQEICLHNNTYLDGVPRFINTSSSDVINLAPDYATAAQIANCTVGRNGHVVINAIPTTGSPMGWIMTGSTNATGTYKPLANVQ